MKLVSPALLIEALSVRFPSAAMAPCELEDVCDFITEYATDQGIDLPLKLVIGQMTEGADLFNPASDTPLSPEQYRRLYVEEPQFEQPTRPFIDPARYDKEARLADSFTEGVKTFVERLGATRSLSHGMVNQHFHCPFCAARVEYTHREGVPVCKCTTPACCGNDRWLTYEEFAELGKRS